MSSLKKNIINGTLWSLGGQLISLSIVLITNIWLARLLSPKEFGQLGIIMFFIILANVLTEGGLVGALVRKKEASKEDYSTVFIFNLLLSVVSFFIFILMSSFVANYYKDPELKSLLIVSSFGIIIGAFQITQNTKMLSDLKFKQRSIYTIISVIISSAIGVFLGYKGFGVWSLIALQLINTFVFTILLWSFEGFFFQLKFSKNSFKELYGFGVNTTLSSFLNTAFDNIYQLILGRYFSLIQVGLFYQAKKLQDVSGGLLNAISQNVVFSNLAKLQDDKPIFIVAYSKISLYFSVFLGLMSCFVYTYSANIILILFGDKWVGAIFYMQLLTISSFFYLSELINRVVFKIFNQTRNILYLELIKKGIQSLTIIIGLINSNIDVLIIGFVVSNFISYCINYYYSRKILDGIDLRELIIFIKIIILATVIALIFSELISYFNLDIYNSLITIPFLILIYLIGTHSLNIINFKKEYSYIIKSNENFN
jgi:O-antigen/teichoic acid export membrane protein